MAYNNYRGGNSGRNGNRNRNNYNGYNNRNNNRRSDDRDFERNNRNTADNMVLDVRRFRRKDIKIVDLNGKGYTINGNFSHEFAIETGKYKTRIDALVDKRKKGATVEDVAELFAVYKDFCLMLINHNVEGVVYTMDDVNKGFNDLDALAYILNNIFKIVQDDTADIGKV